jgi:hypothetical protein
MLDSQVVRSLVQIRKVAKSGDTTDFIVMVEGNMRPVLFQFSGTLMNFWGYPDDEKLKEVITAYLANIELDGDQVILRTFNVEARSLPGYITFLLQ